ncbi:MAG: hypothetical protein JST16_15805 [Bdellovibrionales bacterium]|nr:hypothetical protein [Bdellovibrionales bacterium]
MNQPMILKSVSSLILAAASSAAWAAEPNAAMGQGLYEQAGANSCLYCHGTGGHDGKVAVAAKLNQPKTWKVYKALGGDAAFAKDKADFLKKMEEATVDLIVKGAIAHNSSFKPAWFDWKKTGGTYNAQMLGVTGAPSAAWINKYKDKGVTKEIAAKAAYLHIQSFDSQGVFK